MICRSINVGPSPPTWSSALAMKAMDWLQAHGKGEKNPVHQPSGGGRLKTCLGIPKNHGVHVNNGSVFPIVLSCLSWNSNFPLNNDFGRKSRLFYDINDVILSLKEEIEGFYWLDLFFFVCLCVFMHHVLTCCHSLHWVEMIPYVSSTFYRGRLIPPIVPNMCKSSGDKKKTEVLLFFF